MTTLLSENAWVLGGGILLATTDQMASSHVPSALSIHVVVTAARARLSASRCDGASTTLAPVTTTSTTARTRGTGQEQGRTRQMKARSPCPPRVLQGRHPRSFTALPKPLHKALSCPSHVVPKLYTKHDASGGPHSGIAQHWARIVVGRSPGDRVSHRVGSEGIADPGQVSRSFSAGGAPPGHLPQVRYKTSPPTRRDTRSPAPARPAAGQHLARAIGVPLPPVNHGQQRGAVTRPDHRWRPLTAQ